LQLEKHTGHLENTKISEILKEIQDHLALLTTNTVEKGINAIVLKIERQAKKQIENLVVAAFNQMDHDFWQKIDD
jgi:hypothetical protein